jgi:branched-chain amino acid transport system ATP-binding protein/branched-chain amino acid transport system permease protein
MTERDGAPSALRKLGIESRRAAGEAARAWSPEAWLGVGAVVVAAMLPLVLGDELRRAAASGLYIALMAVGLNFAVGLGGMPSLGQGAFVGIGAFAAALLRVRAGWDPALAVVMGTAAAAAAGVAVGIGATRLRGAFVAVATWVVSWLLAFALAAFPGVFGGSQGLAVAEAAVSLPGTGGGVRLTPAIHFELALVLIVLAVLAYGSLARSPAGLRLAAVRQGPAAAAAIGVRAGPLLMGAFVTSAALGGLAGALAVLLLGVADPTAYGPLLSVELFVAVLLGGQGSAIGPLAGAAVLAVIPPAARALGSSAGIAPERFEPVVASALLLGALFLGRAGVRGSGRPRRDPSGRHRRRAEAEGALAARPPSPPSPGSLEATGLAKRFGGIVAAEEISIAVAAGGSIHAVIGPNGSGKTTLLRLLAGTMAPDAGRISLDGRDVTALPSWERVRLGIVRTLPVTTVFGDLTALEHVMIGSVVRRRHGGAVRSVLKTPLARAEQAAMRAHAEAVLGMAGLSSAARLLASSLSGADQRLLMLATAFAASPSVLLVDEPSAGMSAPAVARLLAALRMFAGTGTTLVVVEHNLRLVRTLARRVTVLDAGRVIAEGSPNEVASNPAVREAYLGSARL